MAIFALCAAAYAVALRRCLSALELKLDGAQRRESALLHAARELGAASRDSTGAVLEALDRTLRALDPALDAVLVFLPSDDDLACIYASGERSAHFAGARLPRDHPDALPALAARCGHRAALATGSRPVIPTDRAALAAPMLDRDALGGVVYAASAKLLGIADPDLLVRVIEQAASPYAAAAEREAYRADATYDGLTGLYTPRAFRGRLQEDLSLARATDRLTLSLWFVDTDNFKAVNDTFGHAAGDMVLRRMSALLCEHLVPGIDLAARNGGDEFCAILRNAHKVAAIQRAQRFCEAVRRCDFGVPVRITASIGVAAYPYDAPGPNELLEVADAAMYHSKRAGRDRVSFALGAAAFAVYS